ncbi:MAG: carbon-nitrogen family hydrolase [Phycisphaerales bacterium]|nr:carbon-nitrogen family hydrolase [Phycisphaerales bacterium]
MRAHLVQLDIAWEEPEVNFRQVETLLDRADIRSGDLVLLPEMFDTGFSLATEKTADKAGRTLAFLAEFAADLGCWVQGGRTVHDCHCTKASNRMSVLRPDGSLACEYSKIHPFSFGREPERFEGGERVESWEWACGDESLTVCPAICYDLRFPELFRIGASRGAEVFALGACWPAPRRQHWRALAIARAIENQAYVLAVNRAGDDPFLHYAGGSIVVDPQGEIVGELAEGEGVLSAELDPAGVRAWREQFPALRDLRLRSIR